MPFVTVIDSVRASFYNKEDHDEQEDLYCDYLRTFRIGQRIWRCDILIHQPVERWGPRRFPH
jgi:hypothetical protein